MKKFSRYLIRILISFALFIALAATVDFYLLDGLRPEIFMLIFPSDQDSTVYTPGYSYRNFRKVKIGMSREEVIKLLGEPFSTWYFIDDEERKILGMKWSRTPNSGSYRVR
jgi:outer membrane protein assembly factor BamE (lipoprotein component of BamABCDE complex)